MKDKYKKFNQYLTHLYYGLNITPLRTYGAARLISSQINDTLSAKMKELRKDKQCIKILRDFHHRIRQKKQRILRESRKQFIGVIDEIEV